MPTQEIQLACTPAELLLAGAWRRPFLLDGGGPDSWGSGFAFFGHTPRATLRIDPFGRAEWRTREQVHRRQGDPIALLEGFRDEIARCRTDTTPIPFAGGLLTMLSYDLKHWIERLPGRALDDQQLPVVECAWYDWALAFDYRTGGWLLTSEYLKPDELRAQHRPLLESSARRPPPFSRATTAITSNFTRASYRQTVQRALEYIAAGDIYQVNLAQRFSTSIGKGSLQPAATLFEALQRRHPMPFSAYLDCDQFSVVSNSPECFLRLGGEQVTTYPIKGTRPRGADNAADVRNARDLQSHRKEGAEHVMIVDLERNDLGRVCQTGSVEVTSFARVMSFPTLHHLVSEVQGRLKPGTSLTELIRATFPGGSITGAPKIRAMEIIDELEPVRRGVYTGAVGYLDADGGGVFNIAIRTAVVRKEHVTYHAGGAVVADSDADAEYEETLLKARAFLQVCGVGGPT
jgi:para-aminobenzoate synthetase component 1